MTITQAVILGIVQGLTEFLPVSSSGHLVLGQQLMGIKEPALIFDVAVHVGTLVAVLAVFWTDILGLAVAPFKRGPKARVGKTMLLLLAAATVPTALMGFFLKDYFEALFGSVLAVGIALLCTGGLLMCTLARPFGKRGIEKMGLGRALAVGFAQGMAITPGVSRSGATIATALLLGVERDLAARFSFLLSIPAICGALVLQLGHWDPGSGISLTAMIAGGLASAVTGYAALKLLLGLVKKGKLHWFAYYCWAVGLMAVFWSW